MTLTPTLRSINDLFGKLERELYRAYHEQKIIHKVDHFHNFCVTAHSMKDFFFEHKRIFADLNRYPYRKKWNENKLLVAVSEIANSSKHFILRGRETSERRKLKTRQVRKSKSPFVELYIGDGKLFKQMVELPDVIVTLENGDEVDLYEFTKYIAEYWQNFLTSEDIPVRQQEVSELLPQPAYTKTASRSSLTPI